MQPAYERHVLRVCVRAYEAQPHTDSEIKLMQPAQNVEHETIVERDAFRQLGLIICYVGARRVALVHLYNHIASRGVE